MNYNFIKQLQDRLCDPNLTLFVTSDDTISHGDFYLLVKSYARKLQTITTAKEPVVIALTDDITSLAVFFGLMYIGSIPVVCNPRARKITLNKQVSIINPKLCIVDKKDIINHSNQVTLMDLDDLLEVDNDPLFSAEYNDVAFMLWTSGTSGGNRPVMYSHGRHFEVTKNLSVGMHFLITDRSYCTAKMNFIYHLNTVVFNPMYNGGQSYIDKGLSIPSRIQSIINSYQPSQVFSVPVIYAQLLSNKGLTQTPIRYHSAGERLPESIINEFQKQTNQVIYNNYGSTEMACPCVINFTGSGAVGLPINGYELRIVDDENNLLPPNKIGHLEIRSKIKSLGYFGENNQDHPMYSQEWSRTSDMAHIDELGFLWHFCRTGDLIKIHGQYVNPLDIEDVLLRHPSIEQAAVVVGRDCNDLDNIKAYVVLSVNILVNASDIRLWLKNNCETIFPREIIIVTELPRTDTGKIQRYKLRDYENI